MQTIYRFKIAFVLPYMPMTRLMRIVDIPADATWLNLHYALSLLLDIHAKSYYFYLSKQKLPNVDLARLDKLPHLSTDLDTPLSQILAKQNYCYYRIHVGCNRDVLIRLRVIKIFQQKHHHPSHVFNVIDAVGQMPTLFVNLDEHISIISALALIATASPPVHMQELMEHQVSDTLLAHKLIKPYLTHNHRASLSPKGESVLAHFIDNLPK